MGRQRAGLALVRITWDDAETSEGWEPTKTIRDSGTRTVVSVGWLIAETPTYIIIAADKGQNDDDTNRRLTIPRAWIIKTTRL